MAKKAAKPKSKKPVARRKPKAQPRPKGERVHQGETNSVLDGAMKSVIRNAFLNRAG